MIFRVVFVILFGFSIQFFISSCFFLLPEPCPPDRHFDVYIDSLGVNPINTGGVYNSFVEDSVYQPNLGLMISMFLREERITINKQGLPSLGFGALMATSPCENIYHELKSKVSKIEVLVENTDTEEVSDISKAALAQLYLSEEKYSLEEVVGEKATWFFDFGMYYSDYLDLFLVFPESFELPEKSRFYVSVFLENGETLKAESNEIKIFQRP